MGDIKFTFKKEERLSHYKLIEKLFEKGKKIHSFPFLVIYSEMELPTDFPCQTMFSVTKRRIRKAVNRNQVKRKLKEAYRKNKQYAFCFVYLEKTILPYAEIEEKMKSTILKLEQIDELVAK